LLMSDKTVSCAVKSFGRTRELTRAKLSERQRDLWRESFRFRFRFRFD